MASGRSNRHGILASVFGLFVLVVPGVLAAFFAVFHDLLPGAWGAVRADDSSVATAVLWQAGGGVGLVVLAWGLFSFWRWAWVAYLGWAAVTIYGLSQTMFAGEAVITLEGFSILVPLGLPYLWLKRRDFGIGTRGTSNSKA